MSDKISIRVETDLSFNGTEIIIRSQQKTALVERIINAVECCEQSDYPPISAYKVNNPKDGSPKDGSPKESTLFLLEQYQIIRAYTETRKIIICTENGRYEIRQSLRDLEKLLDRNQFTRISRFEIINLHKVSGFDFSKTGTIRVLFGDGSDTWVARRYVQSIQQALKNWTGGKETDGDA